MDPQTIDEYIVTFPEDVRKRLEKIRQTIRKAAPKAKEVISYQMPTFRQNGILVHFAAFTNHISFFPTPSVIEAFKKELSSYETSKGPIKFPKEKPIPFDLITDIVKFRVKENLEKEEEIVPGILVLLKSIRHKCRIQESEFRILTPGFCFSTLWIKYKTE